MELLSGTVKDYAWGSATAMPRVLGTPPTGGPQAELWFGAHEAGPSATPAGTLDQVIAADPAGTLGSAVVGRFGARLPFLLKVLAAAAPLSLQVHPSQSQAEEGYAAEERRGVPLPDPTRNYKDRGDKPEMICALEDGFTGVCGFRPIPEAVVALKALDVGEVGFLIDILSGQQPEPARLAAALRAVLGLAEGALRPIVAAVAATAPPYADLAARYPADPGVPAALLLNPFELRAGEAVYLGAGVPHAYLDGIGVEIMAASDNTLRAGLTPKHVDVDEVLRVVRFEAGPVHVLRPEPASDALAAPGELVYPAPSPKFRLSIPAPGGTLPGGVPQILLCVDGTVSANGLPMRPGQAIFVPAGETAVELSGAGKVFRATVGAG